MVVYVNMLQFLITPLDDSAFFLGVGAGNVWDECQEGSPKQGASFH